MLTHATRNLLSEIHTVYIPRAPRYCVSCTLCCLYTGWGLVGTTLRAQISAWGPLWDAGTSRVHLHAVCDYVKPFVLSAVLTGTRARAERVYPPRSKRAIQGAQSANTATCAHGVYPRPDGPPV